MTRTAAPPPPKMCAQPGCRRTLPAPTGKGGRPAKYCLAHRENKTRDAKRAATQAADPETRKQAEEILAGTAAGTGGGGGGGAVPDTAVSRLQRLAVALGSSPVLEEAAEAAGLSERGKALEAMAARARELYPGLVEHRTEAVTGLLNSALLGLAIRLRDVVHHLPPTLAATSLKQAADVVQRLTGGVGAMHSQIEVVCPWETEGEEAEG